MAAILSALFFTQSADAPLTRHVHGQVLLSRSDPAIQITFNPRFKYVGGQRFMPGSPARVGFRVMGWKLYGVAEAEQHFFVQAGADGQIERFYCLQFETLPARQHLEDRKTTVRC